MHPALDRLPYREIWAADFEFVADPGERPWPVCMVALELRTGRLLRLWENELRLLRRPPFEISESSAFVAYFASAELGCFLALGWPHPRRILDLFTECRALTNGMPTLAGNGLLGALRHYGLDAMGGEEKESMRSLIMGGGPWSAADRAAILDYCEEDVRALERLLPAMLPAVAASGPRLAQALFRGRYMGAVARMEHAGVPIDAALLGRLRAAWREIELHLIADVDQFYGVYRNSSFNFELFEAYLARQRIPWPRTESGRLCTDRETFRLMGRAMPQVTALADLQVTLSQLRLHELAVGSDGRNRTLLSPFRARSGRNQPSNSRFVFGPARWIRSLIVPPPGRAVAYLDWSAQEVAIAAALSCDAALIDAYQSGDPYLAFAIQAGLAPADATKETHESIRDACKTLVLGTNYGMQAPSLASRAGLHRDRARELLLRHREAYRTFWSWAEAQVDAALLGAPLVTPLGWPIRADREPNVRSLQNFPMQAAGADMLRLGACLAAESGHTVCAPIHDALLIEGDAAGIEAEAETVAQLMRQASTVVTGGLEVRVDVAITRHPERYADKRGGAMFETVMRRLEAVEAGRARTRA